MGQIISLIVGGVLALGAGFGLTSTVAGSTPAPVDQPYIVYGNS